MAVRVIVTGAPGTGKTTLIDALHARGWATSPEVSREVIERTQLTPWGHAGAWATECGRRMRVRASRVSAERTVFFDRAEPDLAAYLVHAGIRVDLRTRLDAYATDVLFLPLWPDIFRPESAREQTWADAVALDQALRRVYQEAGYRLHEVPRAPVPARVAWVENWMRTCTAGKEQAWAI